MVAETDDKEERTEETGETPSSDSALIAWIGAIHAELRAMRAEIREVSGRVGRLEERVAHIEGGIEAERDRKNLVIMWLGIGVGILAALATVAGVTVGVIGLLN